MWTDQHEQLLRRLGAQNYFQDVMNADLYPPQRQNKQQQQQRLYPNLRNIRLHPYHVSDRYCTRILKRMQERYR